MSEPLWVVLERASNVSFDGPDKRDLEEAARLLANYRVENTELLERRLRKSEVK